MHQRRVSIVSSLLAQRFKSSEVRQTHLSLSELLG